MFNNYPGNDKLIERLNDNAREGNISHAYLFESDKSINLMEFAMSFIKSIVCTEEPGYGCERCTICRKINHGNYEDLYVVSRDGASVKNEQIMKLQSHLRMKPVAGDRNIAIIENADTMTLWAQNRLLKTLEEPPEGTVIILLCNNIDKLVQTILSRCLCFRLNSFNMPEAAIMRTAKNMAELIYSSESYYAKFKKIEAAAGSREKIDMLLDGLEVYYRNEIAQKGNRSKYSRNEIYNAVDAIENARNQLDRNVKPEHVLKRMVIRIGG